MTHFVDQRWIATPNPAVTKAVLDHREDVKFQLRYFSKVDVGFDPDDCWIWTGALSSEGYGNFTVRHHTVRAHRVGWIIAFGSISDGMFLDHRWSICRGRFCVNPAHLEEVTNEENSRRAVGTGKLNQRSDRDKILRRRAQQRAQEEAEQWQLVI